MQCVKRRYPRSLIVFGGLILVCISIIDFVRIDSRSQSAASTASEEAALRAVIESYFAACGKKDLAGVMALWSEKSPNLAPSRKSLEQQFTTEDLSYGSLAVSRVEVENERASLRAMIALTSINLRSQQKSERRLILSFELVKEAGAWKVWRSASAAEDLAEALVKASGKTELAALLTEERELVTAELWRALMAQGQRLYYQSSYDRAKEIFELVLEVGGRIGAESVRARALQAIGIVLQSQGDYAQALEQYQKSLRIWEEIGDKPGIALTLNDMGEAYWLSGKMQEAMNNYHRALDLRREIGERPGEAESLLGIARVEQKRGALTQARQTIEQAIGIIESVRANIDWQESRASYFASIQEYYESYIGVLMEQHRQNPAAGIDAAAFAVSERARARSLLELLTESRADIRQGVEPSLLERERSLQQRFNARAAAQVDLLNRKHTSAQAEAAAKEIASLMDEYEEIRAQIRQSSPRYAALTQPQPLNLTEIQQQVLDPETLLLEYSMGNDASYLFLVSQASITSYQLPKRAEIEAATRRAHELLTAPQPRHGETEAKRQARIKEAKANYWPQAAVLSRMLLGPVASQLGAKRLLIVADGALQYLPFGALPIPDVSNSASPHSFIATTPLMVEHEIVHLPSASALAVLRRELAGRQPATKTVAVLADPVFSADDARVKPGNKTQVGKEAQSDLTRAVNDVRGELRRLLMTRDEAEAILSATPPNAGLGALDFRANRAAATSDELSHYRIVHFATHGLLNSEHPELSGLVLSLVDERGQPLDGFFRLHDIFNLRLPAELVVLSACQTGLGKEVKREGLVGLTRGFMYAGAARVVASLWQVNDAATAELMKRFYRRMLKDGMRPAAALRAAQIEMWKKPQWQSPFYWGALVLQGEWK